MTLDQIRKEIESGLIKAITLDTSAFGKPDYLQLEHGYHARLNQFNDTDIQFVLSDVVLNELRAHMTIFATQSKSELQKCLKHLRTHWQIPDELCKKAQTDLCKTLTPDQVAERRLSAFISATGCEIINILDNNTSVIQIMEAYFTHKPPFSNTLNKKNEFPDAFALTTLENWAISNNTKILVVSNDSDWIKYCDQSKYLVHIKDISDALSLFNSNARIIANKVSNYIYNEKWASFKEALGEELSRYLAETPFLIEATSRFFYTEEYQDTKLISFDIYCKANSNPALIPIEYKNDTLTSTLILDVTIEIECEFSLDLYDSIDHDYSSMGTTTQRKEIEIRLSALVTCSHASTSNPEIENVEVLSGRHIIEFGELEPDFDPDDSWADPDDHLLE